METKVAKLEDSPRWGRLIQWLRGGGEGGFLERQVVIEEGGEPVAVLMDPDTVQARKGAALWREKRAWRLSEA